VEVTDQDVEVSYRLAREYKGSDPVVQRRCRRLLSGSEEEALGRLRDFIRRERIRVALIERARPLRDVARVVIHLEAPPVSNADSG
jgi:hypothetical protein